MNIEDIKVGETYNVRVKVLKKENGKHIITNTLDSDGCINSACTTTFLKEELSAFSPITPDPTPKHDPCRRFKKGDIVEVKEDIDGRNLHAFTTGLTLGKLYTVEEDEKDCKLKIKNDDGYGIYAFVHFKLVTPVEELERHTVEECGFAKAVYLKKNGKTCYAIPYGNPSCFCDTRAEALAAAEAECARLNAEYRKEQSNG